MKGAAQEGAGGRGTAASARAPWFAALQAEAERDRQSLGVEPNPPRPPGHMTNADVARYWIEQAMTLAERVRDYEAANSQDPPA